MPINTLPDLCLIQILDQLSISHLTDLRLVCHRWAFVIPAVFRKKPSLSIFGCNSLEYYSNVHSLRCDRLNFFGTRTTFDLVINFCVSQFSHTNDSLLAHFPNISELTIVHYNITSENQANLALLLSNWPNLRKLNFIGLRAGSVNWNLFAKALNNLRCLRELSIDVNISRVKDLSIFLQLKKINCRFVLADRVELNLYERSLPNQLIGRSLERVGFYVEDNGLINSVSKAEAGKVHRLAIIVGFLSQLKLIAAKFNCITYLDLTFYDNESNIECFLNSLALLKHLHEFKLFLSPLHNYFMKITEANIGNLPKLTAIRQVELQFPIDPHKFTWIEGLFPNARRITIEIGHFLFTDFSRLLCQDCGKCRLIEEQMEALKEQPNASLKFSIKNDTIYL